MTTSRGLASRYGRALLDVALRSADPDRVLRDLDELTALVDAEPRVAKWLSHPGVLAARKRALLERLFQVVGEPDPLTRRLVTMLAERGRLGLLGEIARVYRARLMEHRRIVQATVTTAVPLAPTLADRLRHRLSEVTGRQVDLIVQVDADLLGGVVARIGSLVYDGSVRRQLERIKERLQQAV